MKKKQIKINIIHILYSIALVCFFLFSCKNPVNISLPEITTEKGVLAINEGNFQRGNGSISRIQTKSDSEQEVILDIFSAVNKRPLGDVVQSAAKIGNEFWIVVNNSGKIEIVEPATYRSITTINGLNSPRFIMPVSNDKVYVSDLYANAITVINPLNRQIINKINCPGWTERMILSDNKVFVTNLRSKNLYVIDTKTDQISDSIAIDINANSLVKDKENYIWVLCGGNSMGTNTGSGLYRIDAKKMEVVKKIRIEKLPIPPYNLPDELPTKLTINVSGDSLYYLNYHLYSVPITAQAEPDKFLIDGSSKSFYALGYRPEVNQIWVSDSKDFLQQSDTYVYTSGGILLKKFKTGIVTGNFYFE